MSASSGSLVADTLCKLYALGLIVLGIIFATSRILATGGTAELTNMVYDVFHIILCAVGILFFLFMLIYLVRQVSRFDESEIKDSGGQDGIELRGMSRAGSTATLNTLQIPTVDNSVINRGYTKEIGNTLRVPDGRTPQQDFSNHDRSLSMSALDIPSITYGNFRHRRADSVVTMQSESQILPPEGPVPPALILRQGEASYPNFYVRAGAVLFGICALVTWGIAIASVVELVLRCSLPVPGIDLTKHTLQTVFAALQLQFIFKYSKISVNRYAVICRFGFMHLMAANLNIWIRVIIAELNHSDVMESRKNVTFEERFMSMEDLHVSPEQRSCITNVTGVTMLATASQFAYPLIIEFSLIGAVSFYNIYQNIGLAQKIRQKRRRSRAQSSVSSTVLHFPHHQAVNVTCHKSYKGAFVGVIMAAITIISCVFYNIHEISGSIRISGAIFNFTEIVLLAIAVVSVCYALCKIRPLSVLDTYKKGPDETLLMIAAVGIYMFEFYSIYSYVSAGPEVEVWIRSTGALSGCLALLQATLQVMFVYDGLRRRTATTKILRRKPGREAVVLLLLLNLAMWVLYSFEIHGGLLHLMATTHPSKANEWIFMTMLCKPLAIFFRFHSTTCLYEIWKNSYKLKKSTGE
ncbi:proton channel OtopLc-like [Lineus longissimus]|uniref:proton channel OtopLc-like n=1 Tax=Lineus longissimus TaxID=88925 RepID=UPI002B4D400F